MPKITYLPDNLVVEAEEGQDLLHAALDAGLHIDHACGGFCACSTCHVIVEQGFDSLSEQEDAEADRLEMAEGLTLKSRLACQARLSDQDVVVRIPPQKGLA